MTNYNGNIIGIKRDFTLEDNSGVHDLFDQYNLTKQSFWKKAIVITDVTPNLTPITEGFVVTFTVTDSNGYNGTLYYSLNNIQINDADPLTGSFELTDGVGTFDVGFIADGVPEDESFTVSIRVDGVQGEVIFTSPSLSIVDAAAPTGEDLRTSFYSVAEFQNNDSQDDTTSNYSVSEVQQDYTGTGRLYLIHKCTQVTSFYNDVPIACIQVLNSTGTSVNEQWWFGVSDDGQGWTTHTLEYDFGAIGAGVNITPDQAATNYSYVTNVVNGSTADRFSLASGTGSADTGAVDGIAEPTGPMTLGEKTVPQSPATYYMYRETSGAVVPQCTLCRSPSRSWSGGERIRIAYIIGNATGYTPTDTLFFGISNS